MIYDYKELNPLSMNFQTELIYVNSDLVSCNGGNKAQSHPLIYLDLSSGKETVCPYCSKKFKKK